MQRYDGRRMRQSRVINKKARKLHLLPSLGLHCRLPALCSLDAVVSLPDNSLLTRPCEQTIRERGVRPPRFWIQLS